MDMSPNIAKYPRPPFTQAIKLYGDRAGSKGTFRFAGFAWIDKTKVILVHGDADSLSSAAEWRCLLRLTRLAHRLKKPIVFWNLPGVHRMIHERRSSLENTQAIQAVELELLQLPHPILTVLDETHDALSVDVEPLWSDRVIRVGSPDTGVSEHEKITIARHPTDIAAAILASLCETEALPATELIKNRHEALRSAANIGTAHPSNPSLA